MHIPPYIEFPIQSQIMLFFFNTVDLKIYNLFTFFLCCIGFCSTMKGHEGNSLSASLTCMHPISLSVCNSAEGTKSIDEISGWWYLVSDECSVSRRISPDLHNTNWAIIIFSRSFPLCLDFSGNLHLSLVPWLLWRHMLFKHFKSVK